MRVALASLVVGLLSFGAWTALAQTISVGPTPNPLPGSQFQGGDGNQDNDSGFIDWQGLQADGRVGHTSDPNANDNVFTGGSKELSPDGWGLTTSMNGATPASGNVLDIYRAFEHPQGGDAFVYLAFTRAASNGTIYVTFELNQDARKWTNSAGATIPCRTTGDILISFDDHGSTADVQVDRWMTATSDAATGCAKTGTLQPATGLTPNGDVQAAFNYSSAITNYLPGFYGASIPQLQFGEAAINLSAVVGDVGDGCRVFGSTWMHSRSSLSSTADMKDYVAPQPFEVRTCKANPDLASVASGQLNRKAHRHRLRRHRALSRSLTIYDTAILSGGDNPTGTITFKLFGPNDDTCTGTRAFTDTATAAGNGAYQSGSFAPTAVGTYRWVVEYSGDNNNNGAGPTKCGADAETVVISKASPTLTTTASGPLKRFVRRLPRGHVVRLHTGRAGGRIYDQATLAGGFNPTGTIAFKLYGPDDPDCSGTPASTSTAPVNGNGTYGSEPFTPTAAGTYRWVATYSGDANNNGAGPTACGDPSETTVIARALPRLTTLASGATTLGSPISDSATLTGGSDPTGTITFKVYGPDDSTCGGAAAHTSTASVNGNDTYHSAEFTPTATGTYRWVASYSGDGFNAPAGPTGCDDRAEAVVVAHPVAQPSLSTVASPSAPSGSPIHDTATLSGGSDPTGTITFEVYGPNDNTCAGPAADTSTVTVSGNGNYTSAAFTPTKSGTYRWIATYSGDETNKPAATACNDSGEIVEVTRAQPALWTAAIASVTLPGYTQDAASLSGVNPTGTIVFELFGPDDASCSGTPVFRAEQIVNQGNGVYRSPTFYPNAAGTYRWIATYSGDANNNSAATGCGDSGETTVVLPHQPSLSTSASPPARLHPRARRVRAAGQPIYDAATLAGFRPTGHITFDLYGPNDATCSGPPIFTSATIVDGNGIYNSESFTPTESGTYRWRATYSGDANNNAAGPTACGDTAEQVHVTVPADTSLITFASDAVTLGGAIHDTASLTGGANPTGTITFRLYGPSDTTCVSNEVFTSTVDVNGNGSYTSGSFTPTKPGAYRWVASYSGDNANHGASTACGDAGETGVVRPPDITPVTPSFSTTASPPALGGPIYDTAHLSSGIDPGGAITFKLFGPDDTSCAGPPVFTAVTAVDGNGDYRSAQFVVTLFGTYRWVASYGGDAMNTPVATACGDATETVTVPAIRPTPEPPVGPNVPTPPKPKPPPKPKHKTKPVHRVRPPFTG